MIGGSAESITAVPLLQQLRSSVMPFHLTPVHHKACRTVSPQCPGDGMPLRICPGSIRELEYSLCH